MANMIREVHGLRFGATAYHVDDGFFYYRKKTLRNRVHLVCVHKECPARANMPNTPWERTVDEFLNYSAHSHPPEPEWLQAATARARMIERSATEPTPFQEIYRSETERIPVAAAVTLPFYSLTSAMSRARRAALGNIPQTVADYGVALENSDYAMSMEGEPFYRATLDDFCGTAVIFVSETLIQQAENINHVHIDATFQVVPRVPPAYQLLTISSVIYDHVHPTVFVLMTNKTQALYELTFAFIKQRFPAMAPTTITTDFERALQNSARGAWPEARIVGCWFHVVNNMNKKIRKQGKTHLLRTNPHARKVYKMAQALPLLPAHRIVEGYDAISAYANEHNVLMLMMEFLVYVYRTWIAGVGVETLSVYRQRRRTNNDMESFHKKLKDLMRQPHPNIWIFTDGLRRVEKQVVTAFLQISRGLPTARPPRPQYLASNEVIIHQWNLIEQDNYSAREFLIITSAQLDIHHNPGEDDPLMSEEEDDDLGFIIPGGLPLDDVQPLDIQPAPEAHIEFPPAVLPEPAAVGRGRGAGRGRGGARGRGRGAARGRGRGAARGQGRGAARGRGRGAARGRGRGAARGRGAGRGGLAEMLQPAANIPLMAAVQAIGAAIMQPGGNLQVLAAAQQIIGLLGANDQEMGQ